MTPSAPHLPVPTPAPNPWLRPELVASWREIILIALMVIGPFAWHSTTSAERGSANDFVNSLMSDRHMLTGATLESVLLAFFLWLMHRRGWKPADFKIVWGAWNTFTGVLLLALTEVIHIVTTFVLLGVIYALQTHYERFFPFLMAWSPQVQHLNITVSWSVLTGALILNAFFEEMTCTGYVFNQLAVKLGPFFGLLVTVAMRMSCHTYQGPLNALEIGIVFLVFGAWYWRTKNLWPLIVAHALLDLGSAGLLKGLQDYQSQS